MVCKTFKKYSNRKYRRRNYRRQTGAGLFKKLKSSIKRVTKKVGNAIKQTGITDKGGPIRTAIRDSLISAVESKLANSTIPTH